MGDNYSNDNYWNSQQDVGFESGSPIVSEINKLKLIVAEEVIAKSFLFMFVALLITALASVTVTIDMMIFLLSGYNLFILIGIELVVVFVSEYVISKNKPILAAVLYVVYSYLNGVTLSIIFLAYALTSITSVFLITASIFGVMAVYGLLTDRDLSSVGSILFMGLLGIIVSGLVNTFFLHSSMVETAICCIGVLIFVGLTAYDTQKIKRRVEYANDDQTALTIALYSGFELYLDFINIFLKLLRILGKKR